MRYLYVPSETLPHPDVRVALRLDLLDVERHDLRVWASKTNLVDPRLRISLVNHDERIHLGEVIAAVILVALITRNIVEVENAGSILESSDDFDLCHNRRQVWFHDELDVARHVAELGLSDVCITNDRDLSGVPHFVQKTRFLFLLNTGSTGGGRFNFFSALVASKGLVL